METILRFLKQQSTQQSILALLGLVGVSVSPENFDAIVMGLLAVFAVVQGFRDEDKEIEQKVDARLKTASGGGTDPGGPPD